MKRTIFLIFLTVAIVACTHKESFNSDYDVPNKTTTLELEHNGFKADSGHVSSNVYSKIGQLETVIITLDPTDMKTVILEEIWFKSKDNYVKKFHSKPFSCEVTLENGKEYQIEILDKGVMMKRLWN